MLNEEDKKSLITATAKHIEKIFCDDASGHDWWHIYRVWQVAKSIAIKEKANLFVVELAALLHDLDDWKLSGSGTPEKAQAWLKAHNLDADQIEEISEIIECVSFKGAGVETPMKSLEGKVVQDADRLDAIGAVGIARAFAFGGNRNRLMYHPDVHPQIHQTFEDYKKDKGHTINHFYEKLLLLKDRMNTTTGKLMAIERHAFMEVYLQQFFAEWEGNL